MPIDLEDLRARLRVDVSELRTAPTKVRAAVARMQAAADGSPVQVRVETDEEGVVGEARQAKRHAQTAVDTGGPVKIGTEVDLRQFITLAQRIRDIRTLASATLGPVEQFSRTVARMAVVAGAASAALVAGTGLSGGLLAVAAAASQAAGALPLLAPAVAAFASVSLTAKVAALGVADAIGDKLAPVTEHLSHNAQSLVNQFGDLVPAFTRVKNSIQDAGFAGLSDVVKPLAGRYLPLLDAAGQRVARTFNGVLRSAIRSLLNTTAQWQLAAVLDDAHRALQAFAPQLARIPRIMLDVAAAAGPAFRGLATQLSGTLGRLLDRLQRGVDTGALTAAVTRGLQAIVNLGRIIASVFSAVGSVVRAASATFGGDLLGSIAKATRSLADFAKSAQGQETLRAVFAATIPVLRLLIGLGGQLEPVLKQLAPVVLRLANAFLTALGPVLPIAGDLLTELGSALADILPAVSDVAVAVGRTLTSALKILAPVLPPLVDAIGTLLSPTGALSAVLSALAPVLPVIARGLGDVVTPLAGAFVTAVNQLAPVLPDLAKAFADFAVAVAGGLAEALIAIAPSLPDIAQAMTDLFLALTPVAVQTIGTFADIMKALAPVIAGAAGALADFAADLGPIAPSVIGIVVALRAWTVAQAVLNATLLANPIGVVIALLALLAIAIADVVKQVKLLAPAFSVMWVTVSGAVSKLWADLRGTFAGIIGSVRGWVLSVGVQVSGAVAFFAGLPGRVGAALSILPGTLGRAFSSAFSAARTAIVSGIQSVVGYIQGIPDRIVEALGDLGGILFRAGQRIVQGLIDGIASMFAALRDQASRLAGLITGFLPGSPVREGPLRVLNRGYAGRQIIGMLSAGIGAGLPDLRRQLSAVTSEVAALGTGAPFAGGPQRPSAVGGSTASSADALSDAVARGAQAGVRDALLGWRGRGDVLGEIVADLLDTAMASGPRR